MQQEKNKKKKKGMNKLSPIKQSMPKISAVDTQSMPSPKKMEKLPMDKSSLERLPVKNNQAEKFMKMGKGKK